VVANEVINGHDSTAAASVIRAMVRDVKRYMALGRRITATSASTPDQEEAAVAAAGTVGKPEGAVGRREKGQRVLPVGVSAADVISTLKNEFEYLSSGREDEAIDFFAVSGLMAPCLPATCYV
jgi:hypothetical protein